MLHPTTLGKDIVDLMEFAENTIIEAVYIPKELMPTGEVSSAHAARLLREARRLQLFGPDIPSERERIEKEYEKTKQAVRCSLVGELTSVLKAKIASAAPHTGMPKQVGQDVSGDRREGK